MCSSDVGVGYCFSAHPILPPPCGLREGGKDLVLDPLHAVLGKDLVLDPLHAVLVVDLVNMSI